MVRLLQPSQPSHRAPKAGQAARLLEMEIAWGLALFTPTLSTAKRDLGFCPCFTFSLHRWTGTGLVEIVAPGKKREKVAFTGSCNLSGRIVNSHPEYEDP